MHNFHQKHKHHIRLWMVLAIVTLISAYFAFVWQPTGTIPRPEVNRIEPPPLLFATSSANSDITTDTGIFAHTVTSTTPPAEGTQISTPIPSPEPVTIGVALIIEEATFDATVPTNSSAYDLMKNLVDTGQIQAIFKDYGSTLGYLVEEINGVKNSLKNHKYWIYYINGEKAQIGISNYHLEPGDIITWKYEDETS